MRKHKIFDSSYETKIASLAIKEALFKNEIESEYDPFDMTY